MKALRRQADLCAGWRVRDVVAHVVGNAEAAFTVRRARVLARPAGGRS